VIVVATDDFELYHGVVNELRNRGVTFTTQEPGDPLPERTRLVIAGPDDEAPTDADVEVVRADPDTTRRDIEEALARLRAGGGRTVVGIDPGDRPGIAVLSGDVVVGAFQVPVAEATDLVSEELADAVDPVVRIGDGARLQGARIVDDLSDVRVELVDETGTTPALGTGARGMGDVLAAVNIARIEGEVVENRDVAPTAGELQRIRDRSRERSGGDRSITEALARRVAGGDLTLEEALEAHRADEAEEEGDERDDGAASDDADGDGEA